MIPPLIVQQALSSGITLMAITDHNASANIQAVQQAAAGTDLVVLPGMELQTREEIHSICIFDSLDQIRDFQKWVDGILPNLKNQPDYFGEQFVVDSTGDYICTEPRLLLTSTTVSIDEAWQKVMDLGGILIPAHVDRKSFDCWQIWVLYHHTYPLTPWNSPGTFTRIRHCKFSNTSRISPDSERGCSPS